jgi:hypothetical protein
VGRQLKFVIALSLALSAIGVLADPGGAHNGSETIELNPEWVVGDGRCVDVQGGWNGADLEIKRCDGTDSQHWKIEFRNDHYGYRIENVAFPGFCVGVENGFEASWGDKVHLWQCNEKKSQRWKREHVSGDLFNESVRWRNKVQDWACWDAARRRYTDGTKVILWGCWGDLDDGPNQVFSVYS